ncbi:MAG: hypothetical protein Q7T01_05030 [bacterium]|nr:hypothetical protein [bacterium]
MGTQGNYERSKRMTAVAFTPGAEARRVVRQLLAESAETGHRQVLAQQLCDALCDDAAIDIINRVTISDANQYHRKRGGRTVFKQYGYYQPRTRYLYITNRTAVRGQLLAHKAFLDTLLHEWMHHYDGVRLGLDSVHTSGFYSRLNALAAALGVRD